MPCCRRRMGASGAGRLRCAPQPPATVFLLSTNTQAIDFVPPNGGWIVSPASERLYKAMPGIPRTEDLWRKSAYDDGAIAHIVKNVPFLRSLLTFPSYVPFLARILARLPQQSQVIMYQNIGMNTSYIWLSWATAQPTWFLITEEPVGRNSSSSAMVRRCCPLVPPAGGLLQSGRRPWA